MILTKSTDSDQDLPSMINRHRCNTFFSLKNHTFISLSSLRDLHNPSTEFMISSYFNKVFSTYFFPSSIPTKAKQHESRTECLRPAKIRVISYPKRLQSRHFSVFCFAGGILSFLVICFPSLFWLT